MLTNPPQLIGRYEVIREIGRSNSIVYEAFDPMFGRRVAVKVLNGAHPAGVGLSPDDQARFVRELQANGAVVHPNVMQVFDVGVWQGYPFLVAEFLEGESLTSALGRAGRFDIARTVQLLDPVLSALEAVHARGIIHRDLKPDNIMLLRDGTPKLIDFGIARISNAPSMTMTGAVFGTPHYMSPEQALGQRVDARSDLYSMGVIAYALLSGASPFQRPSIGEMLAAVVNFVPPTIQGVDAKTSAFLRRSLEKDPGTRFQTAAEMRAALSGLVGAPRAAPAPVPVRAAPSPQVVLPAAAPAPPSPVLMGGVPRPWWFRHWREGLILLLLAALVPFVKHTLMLACAVGATYLWFARSRRAEAGALASLVAVGFLWNPWSRPPSAAPPESQRPPTPVERSETVRTRATMDTPGAPDPAPPARTARGTSDEPQRPQERERPPASKGTLAVREPEPRRESGRPATVPVASRRLSDRSEKAEPSAPAPKPREPWKEPTKPAAVTGVAADKEDDATPSLRRGSRLGGKPEDAEDAHAAPATLRGGSRIGN